MMKRSTTRLAGPLVVLAAACVNADPPEEPPYFYLWGAYGDTWSEPMQDLGSEVVRVDVADGEFPTPADAAEEAVTKARAPIAAGRTDPTRIAILLKNFGERWSEGHDCTFLIPADALNPEPIWNGDKPEDRAPYMQPWMNQGRLNVAAWMEAFLIAYIAEAAEEPPLEDPVQFIFDTEFAVINCCDEDYTLIMLALEADANDRWEDDEDYAVPGFPGKSMDELWDDAKAAYGWGRGHGAIAGDGGGALGAVLLPAPARLS